jgi:hypothetical protein
MRIEIDKNKIFSLIFALGALLTGLATNIFTLGAIYSIEDKFFRYVFFAFYYGSLCLACLYFMIDSAKKKKKRVR